MSVPSYPEYKDSGVAWLGDVPSHWGVGALKRSFAIIGGTTPKADNPEFWNDGIPWATPTDLGSSGSFTISETGRTISEAGLASCGTTMVPAGSIILSTRAPIGSLGIAGVPLCTNQGCKSLVPLGDDCPAFFAHLLSVSTAELNVRGSGSTFLELSGDKLGAFQVPVPPPTEQAAIAAFLDRETGKIDALVEEQRRLIALLKEKRQAVISHAVTKGLNAQAPLKPSGIEWLGDVPAHWEVKKLKHIVLPVDGIQMGPFGGMLTDLDHEPTGFKLYGQENTISGDFTRGSRWLRQSQFDELARYQITPGDLVLTRKGSLGGCRVVPEDIVPGIADSDTIRLRVDPGQVSSRFIQILMREAGYTAVQTELTKRGAILAGLNTEVVANLCMVVPPALEQEKILSLVDNVTARLDALMKAAEGAIALLQERRAALISAAVTGKINALGLLNTATAMQAA